jgi:hypothetical protein
MMRPASSNTKTGELAMNSGVTVMDSGSQSRNSDSYPQESTERPVNAFRVAASSGSARRITLVEADEVIISP